MDVEFSPLGTSSQYQIISNKIELIEVEGSFSRYKSALRGYTAFVNNFFSGDTALRVTQHCFLQFPNRIVQCGQCR